MAAMFFRRSSEPCQPSTGFADPQGMKQADAVLHSRREQGPPQDTVLYLRREQGPPQDAVLYLRREQGQSVSGHEFTRAVKAAKINVGLQPLLISPLADAVLHSRREQGPSGP